MNTAIKTAVTEMGLNRYGLVKDHVGSHSIRARNAIAMHLNGVCHNIIKKLNVDQVTHSLPTSMNKSLSCP